MSATNVQLVPRIYFRTQFERLGYEISSMPSNGGRVRWLIASLPGPANWIAWVKFVIVQTGNYKTFLRHCLDNQRNITQSRRKQRGTRDDKFNCSSQDNKSPLAHVRSWKQSAQRHRRIIIYLNLYQLIKYLMLKFVTVRHGYLDCLMLGRVRFMGRTGLINCELAGVIVLSDLINRCTVYLLVPKFKFYALEFLMASYEEVLGSELAVGANERDAGERLDGKSEENFQLYLRRRRSKCAQRPRRRVDTLAYLRNPLDADEEEKWILRPNRTGECWLKLNLWTKFIFYYTIFILICSGALMYWIFAGSVLTNFGFEFNYPSCVAWLRSVQVASQETHHNNYSHIYLAPRVLAREIPIDDLPARIPLDTQDLPTMTWYTSLRVSADVIENLIFYLDNMVLFLALAYILAINSIDVVHNANAIRARLLGLLDKLDERLVLRHQEDVARAGCYQGFVESALSANMILYHHVALPGPDEKRETLKVTRSSPEWPPDHPVHRPFSAFESNEHMAALENFDPADQLQDEISELQAILVDHFCTITRGNNLFVSFIFACVGLFWLLYTVTVCLWMSSVRSRAIELEFVLVEAGVTLFCLGLMVGAAIVRTHNLQLYHLITRSMALDPDWQVTKPRWMIVLKYFYPKPFHCFSIFGSTEISLLLGLEIISWILSVFIVLANFFYAKRFA